MENKYFTPDITDIYVGYELEWKSQIRKQDWKITVCDTDLISIIYDEYEHADIEEPFNQQFRVPYLTKEQIEAEGWTKEKSYFIKNNIYLFFEDKFLVIDSGNPFSWEAIDSEILFKGKCKDINTFRKICKLLEI